MAKPLVTVICICYEHERYVRESISSVLRQTYDPVEVIVVDDGSQDGSVEELQKLVQENPQLKFISLPENRGYCTAFNNGFKRCYFRRESILIVASFLLIVLT